MTITNTIRSVGETIVTTVLQDSAVSKICGGATAIAVGTFSLAKSHIFDRPLAFFTGRQIQPIRKGLLVGGTAFIMGGAALMYLGIAELAERMLTSRHRIDACQVQQGFCDGNCNIRRNHMPQLDDSTTANFIHTLEKEGLVERTVLPVSDIMPTQNEILWKKAIQIASDPVICHQNFTFIVSQDGHILDGHHRWAGGRIRVEQGLEQECNFHVARVNLPAYELVDRANQFPGVTHLAMGQF